jgi:hypothetical protein
LVAQLSERVVTGFPRRWRALTLDQVEIMAALGFELFGPRQHRPKIFIDPRHNEFAI